MQINVIGPQEEKDRRAVKVDAVFNAITAMTPQRVEQYFDNNLSALSGMSPAQIEAYIDANITNLAQAKEALKVLAKDSAFTSDKVKMLAKAMVVLAKQI